MTKDEKLAQTRKWKADNRDKVAAYNLEYYADQRVRVLAQIKDRRLGDPLGTFWRRIYYRHKITQEDYENILVKQDLKCPICLEFLSFDDKNYQKMAVDHNHKSGKIRGILHTRCNLLLGHAQDSYEILVRAAEYLREDV